MLPPRSIIGDGVRGLVKDGVGAINAIANSSSDHVTLRDNVVLGDASAGSTGLACSDSFSSARDVTISQSVNSIVGRSSDGGNALH